MPIRLHSSLPILFAFALLAACGGDADNEGNVSAEADPALSGALSEEIMVDPDLAGQNMADAGVGMGSGDGSLPTENNSAKAIAAAKSEAFRLVGGQGKLKAAPDARVATSGDNAGPDLIAAAKAATFSTSGANCAEIVEYTMAWAAKLPKTFPVYPHGSVQEAAGTNNAGCLLRVINFTTPVALEDVINFYFTRASAAGFEADRVRQGDEDMLGGTKGQAAYVVTARKLPSGRTGVDLVTGGK